MKGEKQVVEGQCKGQQDKSNLNHKVFHDEELKGMEGVR